MTDESEMKVVRKRPLCLLILEDNPADAELCMQELKRAGLEAHIDVVQAEKEFLRQIDAKSYDVVLADYQLRGWTGMDALELLQQRGNDVPFILVSGTLGEEKAVECIKKGVSDYILKDRLARLSTAISRALEQKLLRVERQRAVAELRESEARFRTLTETVASAIFIYQGTHCRYVNRAAEAITGYTREELLKMSSWEIVHPDSRQMVIEQGLSRLTGAHAPARYEVKVLTKQGEARWLDLTAGTIEFDGGPAGLTTAFDITDRKRAEDEIRHLVASDPLTGLANYRRFLDVFDTETQRSRRSGRPFALLLLDLDGLRHINETHGQLVGSLALCRVANVLRRQCRTIDTAARHGDDEFALLLPLTAAEGAGKLGQRVIEHLANDGEQPRLSVSAGWAVYPGDGDTIEKLMQAAERSLHVMKDRVARRLHLAG